MRTVPAGGPARPGKYPRRWQEFRDSGTFWGSYAASATGSGACSRAGVHPNPRRGRSGHGGGCAGWGAVSCLHRHPRAVFTGHHDSVNAVPIAPDGTWLATGHGGDATVRTWATTR